MTLYNGTTINIVNGTEKSLLGGQQTCDSQVVGSSPGWAPLHSGLGQATYTCVPLSPSSIIWYWPRDDLFGWESNSGSGITEFMTNVTCGLTAKKPGSAPCPMLVIKYGTTFCW